MRSNLVIKTRLRPMAHAIVLATCAGAWDLSAGTPLFELAAGDYVHPRFSPRGDYIAVSEVLSDSQSENTRVLLLRTADWHIDTILGAGLAQKYAVYKSYVSEMQWDTTGSRLCVTICDGDVGSTEVVIDTSGRVLREKQVDAEALGGSVSDDVRSKLHALYPELPSDQVGTLAISGLLVETGDGLLSTSRRGRKDPTVVAYHSLRSKLSTELLSVPAGRQANLGGGFASSQAVYFAVSDGNAVNLYSFSAGKVKPCVTMQTKEQFCHVALRRITSHDAWFLLRLQPPYAQGSNAVFHLANDDLRRVRPDYPVSDFDVLSETHRIVFAVWANGRRLLRIEELE